VAGLFYPGDPESLAAVVDELLDAVDTSPALPAPKALIVPHAGFAYSGPVAAAAYAQIGALRERLHRVVLIGPSHRVPFRNLAVPGADSFATPLGEIPVDLELRARLRAMPTVITSDPAHAYEHSLEVQLPFLQRVLDAFTVLPIVTGDTTPAQVAGVLDEVWGGSETLVLVSSDLSHYHSYDEARSVDATTAAAILARSTQLGGEEACGSMGINGLMMIARRRDLRVAELERLNSGDTGGDRSRVVGYGAFAVYEH
jgi:AmmeMemoRadiSam system protein B